MFSGTGVEHLRRYFNSRAEFAEYHGARSHMGRQRSGLANGAVGINMGPTPDADGFDEADGADDDEMGDGSELAIDPGNVGQPDDMIPPPPPPPPQHPGFYGHAHPSATHSPNPDFLQSVMGEPDFPAVAGTNGISIAQLPHNLQQALAAAARSHTHDINQTNQMQAQFSQAGPSTAGPAHSGAGPSEASLHQTPENQHDQTNGS